jgi:outer membrane biosynthesis protein TonB
MMKIFRVLAMMAMFVTLIHPSLSTTSTGKRSTLVGEAERSDLVADSELAAVLRGTAGTIHRRMLLNTDQNQNQNDQQQNQNDQQQNQNDQQQNQNDQQQNQIDQQQNQNDQQQNQNDQQQNQNDQRQNLPADATATAIPDTNPTGSIGASVTTQSSAKAIIVMGTLMVVAVGIIW